MNQLILEPGRFDSIARQLTQHLNQVIIGEIFEKSTNCLFYEDYHNKQLDISNFKALQSGCLIKTKTEEFWKVPKIALVTLFNIIC